MSQTNVLLQDFNYIQTELNYRRVGNSRWKAWRSFENTKSWQSHEYFYIILLHFRI